MNVAHNQVENNNSSQLTLEISQEQAGQLESLFVIAKALASPGRLAIIGTLATRLKETMTTEELSAQVNIPLGRIERDLRQLAEASIITIEEWQAQKPGSEPVPWRLAFNSEYLKLMPQLITVLHQLNSQLHPAEPRAPLDERARTIGRFIKAGRLVGWPAQYTRQLYVLEEVAKVFEPGMRYSERDIDNILKQVYEYDHCTLRRFLVDNKFLHRENGVYWKEPAKAEAVF